MKDGTELVINTEREHPNVIPNSKTIKEHQP